MKKCLYTFLTASDYFHNYMKKSLVVLFYSSYKEIIIKFYVTLFYIMCSLNVKLCII